MVAHRPQPLRTWGVTALQLAAIAVALAWSLFPVYWMLAGSLTPNFDIFSYHFRLWPADATFDNYNLLFHNGSLPMAAYLRNSVTTGLGTALATTVASLLAAYALSRFRIRFGNGLQLALLAAQMFPLVVLIVPLYLVFARTQLLNTNLGLVLAFCSFAVPVGVFLMKSFVDGIPITLDEAARLDGCNSLRVLWHVIFPLAWPGIVAVGVFGFLDAWNDLLFPLVLTSQDTARTLPPGLAVSIQVELRNNWGAMMGACFIASAPPIVALMMVQRWIVGGLATGALRG